MLFLLNSDKRTYKPSSVVNNHLSWIYVAANLHATSIGAAEQAYAPATVLLRIGFTWLHCFQCTGELLPRLSILTKLTWRYISVALALKSPSADVICYPALWSSDFPHGMSFRYDTARLFGTVAKELYHIVFILSNILIIFFYGYIM